jgi:TolB-like protein
VTHVIYEFEGFRLDAGRRLLYERESTQPTAISPRTLEALLFLVEHPGELLAKERLLATLWPRAVVEDNSLNRVIATIRRILQESPGENRYIATVPGQGYRFVADVLCRPSPQVPPSPGNTVTVAVLPLQNLSERHADERIALGIAENVLHRLATDPRLSVVAQTSSFAWRGRPADAREIGARLNARYLVEGSLQRARRRLRITVQLIDTAPGTHVWSLRFDRIGDDVALALEASLFPPGG